MDVADIDQLTLSLDGIGWHSQGAWKNASETDLIWVLSLGARASFLDKVQLLMLANRSTAVINSPQALAFWHAKHLPSQIDIAHLKIPETLASKDKNWLWAQMLERDGDWVIKPSAGSGGEGVRKISGIDKEAFYQLPDHFHFIQRYIPAVSQGEKRILLAGPKIIGQYLRVATTDFRTNLSQGGVPQPCSLSTEEQQAMQLLGALLLKQGIVFAGIDLCWPWLIEINIVSPGGLDTIEKLSGQDLSGKVLSAVSGLLEGSYCN